MLYLIGKQLDPAACPILFEAPFAEERELAGWQVYGGEWRVRDGWLNGRNPDNKPGVILSRLDFPGNVLLEFEGRTVPPSTHDIDMMWNASWDDERGERGDAYVAGIQGWWEGKVGIERSPGYTLNAATPLFPFEPGRTYRIQAGSIDGHCFVAVDGRLLLELTDADPIDSAVHARVGFEAYASHIQVRHLSVRSIVWERCERSYAPEF